MNRRRLIFVLFLPALILLRSQTPPASNSYVDSRQCATCHAKIAETYARTGMGRSFYRPGAASSVSGAVEDFTRGNPYFHEPSSTWYAMTQRDGAWYQRRWRVGPDGKEAHAQELSVDYVMG